jgi:hypothetical protein
VSKTYLRATAATSLAERAPQQPAGARKVGVGRYGTALEEAKQPSRRIGDDWLLRYAALQIGRDLR